MTLVNCEDSTLTVSHKKLASENTDFILFEWLSKLVNEVVYIESSSLMCDAYLKLLTDGIPNDMLPFYLKDNDTSLQIESIQEFPDMAEIEQDPPSSEISLTAPMKLPFI